MKVEATEQHPNDRQAEQRVNDKRGQELQTKKGRKKFLDVGVSSVARGIASETMSTHDSEHSVAGAAMRGFIGGAMSGMQAGGEQQQGENSTSRKDVTPVNQKDATMSVAEYLEHSRKQHVAGKASGRGDERYFSSASEMDAHYDAYQASDIPTRDAQEAALDTSYEAYRNSSAPVRDASGATLTELTASAPGEDPLPGTAQPLALDVIDAVQGKPTMGAVMNPAHLASLEAMSGQQRSDLESEGGGYRR